jgi:hypothetical protein
MLIELCKRRWKNERHDYKIQGDNGKILLNFKEIGFEDWINLVKDGGKWRAAINS